MLTALIALGIFVTILLFLQGCAAVHRAMVPRGTDRAIERIQKWSAPEATAQLDIVRKESLSDTTVRQVSLLSAETQELVRGL